MATQPVLAGYTLPHPSEYRDIDYYRRTVQEMADGSQQVALLSSTVKKKFQLDWQNLTGSERTTVQNAFNAIRESSGSYTDPDGNTYTVLPDGDADLTWTWVRVAGGGFRYSTRMKLRET